MTKPLGSLRIEINGRQFLQQGIRRQQAGAPLDIRKGIQAIQCHRILNAQGPNCRAPQAGQMRPTSECCTDIFGQRANVGSFAARDAQTAAITRLFKQLKF